MVRLLAAGLVACVMLVDIEYALNDKPENKSVADVNFDVTTVLSRRRRDKIKKTRSTSSSGDVSSSKASSESLGLTASDMGSSDLFKVKKGIIPKSSFERAGWHCMLCHTVSSDPAVFHSRRKWHRKCHKCLEDMVLKWRDPRIQWICGAYQRARRSFKSACMMYYRNCQDGTMFVEMHKGRCKDDSAREPLPHGDHFFYEYAVSLSEESKKSSGTTSEESQVLTY